MAGAPTVCARLSLRCRVLALTLVAPDRNRSAASNSLTIDTPVRVVEQEGHRYAVNGTPTDCVHIALSGLFDEEHHLVVSGINDGAAAMAHLWDTSATKVTMPFIEERVAETRELMGDDYWPYGVEANRKILTAFMGYLEEQHFIEKAAPIEDMFAPIVKFTVVMTVSVPPATLLSVATLLVLNTR